MTFRCQSRGLLGLSSLAEGAQNNGPSPSPKPKDQSNNPRQLNAPQTPVQDRVQNNVQGRVEVREKKTEKVVQYSSFAASPRQTPLKRTVTTSPSGTITSTLSNASDPDTVYRTTTLTPIVKNGAVTGSNVTITATPPGGSTKTVNATITQSKNPRTGQTTYTIKGEGLTATGSGGQTISVTPTYDASNNTTSWEIVRPGVLGGTVTRETMSTSGTGLLGNGGIVPGTLIDLMNGIYENSTQYVPPQAGTPAAG